MSVFPTSTQLSTLSSLPTQPQHLKNSDLRIAPPTTEQREYLQQQQIREAKRSLEIYFTHDDTIKRMNQVTHQHRKCVMSLKTSNSSIGSAAWFMWLWGQLSVVDRFDFNLKISQMLGVRPHDFFVQIFERNECPVIFYIESILQPLAERTFKTIERPEAKYLKSVSVMSQAFTVLHNPSQYKEQYRDFLREAYDVPANHRNLMMPLSTSTKLSTLSSLLTQLQDLTTHITSLHVQPLAISYSDTGSA